MFTEEFKIAVAVTVFFILWCLAVLLFIPSLGWSVRLLVRATSHDNQ